jgi:DNA-directed RNA polymerase subunit M/transcription elongation factor TFIIS
MYELGLRNKNGKKISRNGLVCILKNPFYMGLIKIDSIGELFVGIHPPIVSKSLFDEVQDIFAGKRVRKNLRHFFIFRRMVSCRDCQNLLVAERQKGNVYYRCQTRECPEKTVREEMIEAKLLETYEKLQLTDEEYKYLIAEADKYLKNEPKRTEIVKKQLLMDVSNIETRFAKLADAYVDEVFDKETYFAKKNELVIKRQEIKEKLESKNSSEVDSANELQKFLELLKSVCLSYKTANGEEKRQMVQITTSNFIVKQKIVLIKLRKPFQLMIERPRFPTGSPTLATTRTFRDLCQKLIECFRNKSIAKTDQLVNKT